MRFTVRRLLAAVAVAACLLALVAPMAKRWLFDPGGYQKLAVDHAFMARFYSRLAAGNPNHKDIVQYRQMAAYFDRTSRDAHARSRPSRWAGW
jgi:hypothetical protein